MVFANIKYIFFDVGYTLVNEDDVWKERCIAQAQTNEAKVLNLSAEMIFNEIILASKAYLSQFRGVIQKYNFKAVAPYRNEFEKLFTDTKDVLSKLFQKFTLGIIANQEDGLAKRLEGWGLKNFFDLIISSWDCKILKPDIKIFEIALKQANCLPQEAVMIGDRLDNDIAPAKSIGMKTIWVKQGFGAFQTPKDDSFVPDAEVNNLSELLNILQ